uniref:Uncharacterized protein n=1 Tax=Glossina austeni TaxID=7395 RepID=A0A1A9UDV9_GLOAU
MRKRIVIRKPDFTSLTKILLALHCLLIKIDIHLMTWFVDVSWCSQLTFKLNLVFVHSSKRLSTPQKMIDALKAFISKRSTLRLKKCYEKLISTPDLKSINYKENNLRTNKNVSVAKHFL